MASLQTGEAGAMLILKGVVGKLNVNDFVSVQPFLEMTRVTVGLHPNGIVNTGLAIIVDDNVAQGDVDQVVV